MKFFDVLEWIITAILIILVLRIIFGSQNTQGIIATTFGNTAAVIDALVPQKY